MNSVLGNSFLDADGNVFEQFKQWTKHCDIVLNCEIYNYTLFRGRARFFVTEFGERYCIWGS